MRSIFKVVGVEPTTVSRQTAYNLRVWYDQKPTLAPARSGDPIRKIVTVVVRVILEMQSLLLKHFNNDGAGASTSFRLDHPVVPAGWRLAAGRGDCWVSAAQL